MLHTENNGKENTKKILILYVDLYFRKSVVVCLMGRLVSLNEFDNHGDQDAVCSSVALKQKEEKSDIPLPCPPFIPAPPQMIIAD